MKKSTLIKTLFYVVTLVAFMMQLVQPTTVFADGDTPPSEAAPTETPVDPSVPPLPEEPVVSEVLPAEVIASGTDLVVVGQSGDVLPLGSVAAEEAIVAGDPIWCPNTVASVVANTSGCSSNFANLLDALTFADTQSVDGTIWIASGNVLAVDTGEGDGPLTFTSSKTYSLTLQGGWDTNITDVTNPLIITSPSIFNQSLNITWGGNLNVYNMTLNGLTAGNVEAMLNLTSTGGNIVMSDVEVSNAQGGGETVDENSVVSFTPGNEGYGAKVTTNTGTVSVSDSTFKDNNHHGLYVISQGAVTLNNILATNNGGQRDLTAGEVTAVENAHNLDPNWDWDIYDFIDPGTYNQHVWWGSGAWVDVTSGNVQVTNSDFGNGTLAGANNYSGLIVNSTAGDITLNGVTSDFNHGYGAILDAQSGNALVTNSTFVNTKLYTMDDGSTLQGWYDFAWESDYSDWQWGDTLDGGNGLIVDASGNITVDGVAANSNQYSGASLYSKNGQISVLDSEFLTNGMFDSVYGGGLFADSGVDWWNGVITCLVSSGCDITLTNVNVNDNYGRGALIEAGAGGITVQGASYFDRNGWTGLTAYTGNWINDCPVGAVCDVTLTDVTAEFNASNGVYIDMYSGNVSAANSIFSSNDSTGFYAWTGQGNINLTDSSSSSTGGYGFDVYTDEGNITLTNSVANLNYDSGVLAETWLGNVDLNNVTANENNGDGADLYNAAGGTISVKNSFFNSNGSTGLYAETSYDSCDNASCSLITLTNVAGNNNGGTGAVLYTDYGGSISVNGGTFNGNESSGLYAETSYYNCDFSPCSMSLTNIVANDNAGYGAELYTDYGGSITVTSSTFNENNYDGLYAKTAWYDCLPGMVCDVTVNGVTAQNNGWEGANLNTEMGGKITVNGGTYSGNADQGLTAEINEDNTTDLSGAVMFNSVTSTGNGLDGAGIYLYQNGGTVEVTNSVFNLNGSNGLYVTGNWLGTSSIPEILLQGITANENTAKGFFYDGPVLEQGNVSPRAQNNLTPANILICSSTFQGNTDYGIYIMNEGGLTEIGLDVISSGNNLLGIDGLENLIVPAEVPANCVQVPARQIFHGSEVPNIFSCGNNELPLVVMLPNTDWVRIPCGTAKVANVYALPTGSLAHIPGTFISALSFTIQNSISSLATIGFKIPDGVAVERLSIVHWDPATQSWITVGGAEDGSGYFVAQVHQGGIYALVQK